MQPYIQVNVVADGIIMYVYTHSLSLIYMCYYMYIHSLDWWSCTATFIIPQAKFFINYISFIRATISPS